MEAVHAVEDAAEALFEGTGLLDGIDDEPTDPAVLRDAIAESRVWVAVTGGGGEFDIVGFALGIWCGDDAHLQELDVIPDWGRRGIGRGLVGEVVAWAARNGRERVTLTTFAEVPWNGPFYARLGFAVLPPDSWTLALRGVWEHEREMGLPMEQRVVMHAPVSPGPSSG